MADYHVDYINGSDSTGAGSAANPWGTIGFAMAESSAGTGDTIKVAGSGLTTVETGGVLSAADTLTTSSDLTGVISVNDIVHVMPNGEAEYQDWPTFSVVAITATSIQFYTDCYLPGDFNGVEGGTSTYTIKTIDSIYETTTTDNHSNLGIGCDVIGGYNTAFTAIVGLTYLLRGNTNAGSGSGNAWQASHAITNSGIPQVPNYENFHFSRFSRGCDFGYAVSYWATNMHFHMCTSESFSTACNIYNKNGGSAKLYHSNSQGSNGITSYQRGFVENGYNPELEFHAVVGNRNNALKPGLYLTKCVMWNPGFNSNAGPFGQTMNFKDYSYFKDCEYHGNIIESFRGGTISGVNQHVILCRNGGGTIDSLTLLTGNTTSEYWWSFNTACSSDNSNKVKAKLKVPISMASHQTYLPGNRDSDGNLSYQGSSKVIEYTDGTYIIGAGTWERTNTVDQETGNSCREIIGASRMAYGAMDPSIFLAEIEKTAANYPTSIEIRYKATGNAGNGFGTRCYYIGNNVGADLTSNNAQLQTDDTWRTLTFSIPTDAFAQGGWDIIPIGDVFQIKWTWLYYNVLPCKVLVDSITVSY